MFSRRTPPPQKEDVTIVGIFVSSLLGVYAVLQLFTSVVGNGGGTSGDRHWLVNLSVNMLGYSTVFLPGYLIIRYVRRTGYVDRGPPKCMTSLVSDCSGDAGVTCPLRCA